MKKIFLCVILASLMIFALAACNDGAVTDADKDISQNSDASVSLESPAESSDEPEKIPTINGIELSEFTVVYKNSGNDTVKFKTAAENFVKTVKEKYNVKLKCVIESGKKSENEIIFGKALGREICNEMKGSYGIGEYEVIISGTKVFFASSYPTGSYGGCEDFLNKTKENGGAFTDMKFSGEKKIIKVACVGDSITYGATSSDQRKNYPAYLQEMLGLDYCVLNAGISGYSIVKNDQYAYSKSAEYRAAKDLAPDVVLFALGTNDANPTPTQPYKNWDDPANDRTNRFVQSTNELLDAFVKANPDVQIYLILPASLFKVGDDGWNAEEWNKNNAEHVIPLLKGIGVERKLNMIELFDWSIENKSIFVDGLHPKDEGYKVLAQFIYDSIKETIKKAE